MSGAEILDPVWERMVHWHAVGMHEATRETNRQEMKKNILAVPDGESILDKFEALATA